MANDDIASTYHRVEKFLEKLHSNGWLGSTGFNNREKQTAADLFGDELSGRPLVVGLFGGTGVGKSSLLNRLAGESVARTGVVRPTSLEITAYLHHSRDIASLPSDFSVSNFNAIKHRNDKYTDVMWVDMPDFDSDETQNRDQVLQWIPHIDLLIYVVTPERYKDEQGWHLLMSEGYRHGWLFVINQWDKAEHTQYDDFVTLLKRTGFSQPRVFKTVGANIEIEDDQFQQLADLVGDLAERNVVEQLEQIGWFRRLELARQRLLEHQPLLAPGADGLLAVFDRRWKSAQEAVGANLYVPFTQYSAGFAPDQQAPLTNALKALTGKSDQAEKTTARSLANDAGSLWDDLSVVALKDAITEFELAAEEHGVPARRLGHLRKDDGGVDFEAIGGTWSAVVAEAAANPGAAWQRTAQKVFSVLQLVLPAAGLLWVVSRVVMGFVNGASDPEAYVGTAFLVNGAMLVGVSWLLPWLVAYFLRPSVPKAVSEALTDQLEKDLRLSTEGYRGALEQLDGERASLRQEADALDQSVATALARSSVLAGEDVRELLMHSAQ